jgi:putative membrane protein
MKFSTRNPIVAVAFLVGATTLPCLAQTTPANPAMPGMAMGSTDTSGLSPMDKLFMVRAAEGNLAEVSLSQLALRKSKNSDVQMVARTLISEHSKAQAELQATATRKGVVLPTMLSPTHLAVQEKLNKAKKADFDKMFMANQVDDHENTIALFANEISLGQDPDAKAAATKYLPNIIGHTVMIYNVARQVGAPGIEFRPATPPTPPGVVVTPMSDMMPSTNAQS